MVTKNLTAAEIDAVEFGRHEKQDGARQSLLVARSVNTSLKSGATDKDGKLSVVAFTTAGDFTNRRGTTRKYFDAWDPFAKANGLPLAKDLKPGQEVDFDVLKLKVSWDEFAPGADAGSDSRAGGRAEQYAEEAKKAGTTKGQAIRAGSNKKAIAAAIKADPKVAKAAWTAVQEKKADDKAKNLAAQAKAGAEAELSAVEAGNPPLGPDSDEELGAAQLAQADYAVAEAKRRDWVWDLEADAKALYEKYLAGAEEFGHTGVPDEVEVLQSAVHYATEFAFGVNGFVVTTATTGQEVNKK